MDMVEIFLKSPKVAHPTMKYGYIINEYFFFKRELETP